MWLRELFTKMAVRLGVHLGMGEINSSKSLGFLVVKSIILLDFWMGLCLTAMKDGGISPEVELTISSSS